MTTAADVLKMHQGKGGQVRRPSASPIPAARSSTSRRRPRVFTQDKFESGHAFDGSSIAGWKGIQASDMLLMPDPTTLRTSIRSWTRRRCCITCDVIEPVGRQGLRTRSAVAREARRGLPQIHRARRRRVLRSEPEFFIFDAVEWSVDMSGSYCKIFSAEARVVVTAEKFDGGNMGHRPPVKGGYFPVPPVDSLQDIRSAICLALEQMGVEVEVHHHEVAAAGQNEIGTKFETLVKRADWLQILKYAVHNTAHAYGKTATFMPKPIVGDNGSGMHVHQSVWKDGKNLFAGDGYCGAVRVRAVLHRRRDQAREGAERDHQPGHEFVQAPGAGLRGADQPRLLSAQPLGGDPHSVRVESEGRGGSRCASRTRRAIRTSAFAAMLMAGPRRRTEQDPSGRPDGQEPLRPRAGGSRQGAASVRVARRGARPSRHATARS